MLATTFYQKLILHLCRLNCLLELEQVLFPNVNLIFFLSTDVINDSHIFPIGSTEFTVCYLSSLQC